MDTEFFTIWGCSSVGERSVRIREVEGSTPFTSITKCRKRTKQSAEMLKFQRFCFGLDWNEKQKHVWYQGQNRRISDSSMGYICLCIAGRRHWEKYSAPSRLFFLFRRVKPMGQITVF